MPWFSIPHIFQVSASIHPVYEYTAITISTLIMLIFLHKTYYHVPHYLCVSFSVCQNGSTMKAETLPVLFIVLCTIPRTMFSLYQVLNKYLCNDKRI